MDQIINVLLLIIIFVFDPLAIALVIAANFAFEQLRLKKVMKEENITLIHEEDPDPNDLPHIPEEEEWDEDHAHDMVLNEMVKQIEEENIPHHTPQPFILKPEVIEKLTKTNVYGEDIEKKLELLEHPRVKEAIKHAKRAKEI